MFNTVLSPAFIFQCDGAPGLLAPFQQRVAKGGINSVAHKGKVELSHWCWESVIRSASCPLLSSLFISFSFLSLSLSPYVFLLSLFFLMLKYKRHQTGQLSKDPHSMRTDVRRGHEAPAVVAAASSSHTHEMLDCDWSVVSGNCRRINFF